MKISLSWLRRFLPHLNAAPQDMVNALSSLGIAVECWSAVGVPAEHLCVGRVVAFDPHPQADRLRVCRVDVGDGELRQIVCGASNFAAGDSVAVALPGCQMPDGIAIRPAELRGVRSDGMLCSGRELHISDDHGGILILEPSLPLGTSLASIFPNSDVIFELEITANRGDCMSHLGIARELAAYYQLPLKYPALPELRVRKTAPHASTAHKVLKELRVESPHCLQFIAWGVRGLRVGPSPEWLRHALEGLGMRSVNNVVDVTNWGMWHFGQPLHAFDASKIHGKSLEIRQANSGESLLALNHKTYGLNETIAVIADRERPLVIAGVMGSLEAEVDDDTRDIVLEVASYAPSAIQATSRRLGLSTDASQRFARGVDFAATGEIARQMVWLLQEVCGGTVDAEPLSFSSITEGPSPLIFLSADFLRQSVGISIDPAMVRELLERLYFQCDPCDGGWNVTVPTFRRGDVQRPIDLVEEILRLHGLEHLGEAPLRMQVSAREDDRIYSFQKSAAELLLARGFSECYSYSTRDVAEITGLLAAGQESLLLLDNPLTADQTVLRTSLLPGLLNSLRHNLNHGNHLSRVFEIGRVWRPLAGKLFEVLSVSWAQTHDVVHENWQGPEVGHFFDGKSLGEALASIIPLRWRDSQFSQIRASTFWQNDYAAQVGKLDPMGYEFQAGLLHLKRMRAIGFAHPVQGGELLLFPSLFQRKLRTNSFENFSVFPPTRRDFSIQMESHFPAGEALESMQKIIGKSLPQTIGLEGVWIFDQYGGKGIPEGRKNVAFRVALRPKTAEAMEASMDQTFASIWDEIRKLPFAVVRDS